MGLGGAVEACARGRAPHQGALEAKYDGKVNRPEGQITAIEIAAKRWGIPVNALSKGIASEAARLRKNEARRRSRKKP
jgi:hypothetical protein